MLRPSTPCGICPSVPELVMQLTVAVVLGIGLLGLSR